MATPLGHGSEEKGCKDKGDRTWPTTAVVLGPPVRACEASDRAPFKRRLRLTSGPQHFLDLSRFSNTHTLIFELVTFLMSKFHQTGQVNRLEHKEQLHFLYQVQNPKGLQVINFGINSNLNLPLILKGFKHF
jgi:hypothetical protein